jgi:hypothetical protein
MFPVTGNASAPFSFFPELIAAKAVFAAVFTTGRAILGLLYVPTFPEDRFVAVADRTTGAGQNGKEGTNNAPYNEGTAG